MKFPQHILLSFLIIFKLSQFLSASELRINAGGRVTTIDPALAADFISGHIVCALYDTLLEYDYAERPYRLIPAMLTEMPVVSENSKIFTFSLRNDLFFAEHGFMSGKSKEERKVTSKDVEYSFKRIADARINSPGYWIFRDKIKGIGNFRQKTSTLKQNDNTIYNETIEGIKIIDDRRFEIHLDRPDPRFLYMLAMPYSGILSSKAGLSGNDFSETAVGSGPFILQKWQKDYKMIFLKNCDFRKQFYLYAENEHDRSSPLPYIDKITCYLVKQPLSGWLMFLRGELDIGGVDRDSFDAVIDPHTKDLKPELKSNGIKLICTPEFQINYVGFSFTDKRLGENLYLRKAISKAYNIESRIIHSNYALRPVNGPIPPGVAGYEDDYVNDNLIYDLDEAKNLLEKAGYPGGIAPKTGRALEFDFDLGDSSPYYRQLAELMVDDMKKIGIKINPILNNRPKFFQKLSEGKMQIFRLSWVGDYPDAENFLQLFYGPNAGKSNRVFFHDDKFDEEFEKVILMGDCPERTKKYSELARYITKKVPWIFESSPVSYQLIHGWIENFIPNNFANSRWKYLSVNEDKKASLKGKLKSF
ncbi:MAG TPA: ABC transporter substrate-binding protein [Victivallales bacterium]|nr:ABC transporter substrate-binding protein [Victivallales bacterium]